MSKSWAEDYVAAVETALAVVRSCTVPGCKWFDVRRKAPPGASRWGRGTGMREGNKQRGRAIQHVKSAHPDFAPMRGCILPSGNAAEFPKLNAELKRRGIRPIVTQLRGGGLVYQIRDDDIARLPRDEKGPYLGDDESGHSLYPVKRKWLDENRARESPWKS